MSQVSSHEISISVGDSTLRGIEFGSPKGSPIVALHGWLDNAASFRPLVSAGLGAYRVIALDLLGHGLSDHRPPGAAYHFVDWVSLIIDVADSLELEQFTVMGHSMGAGIATLLAGAFPERVVRAVFIEGLGPLTSEPKDAPVNLKRHITEGKQIAAKILKPYPTKQLALEVLTQATGLSNASAGLLIERGMVEAESGGYVWRSDPRMRQRSAARLTEAQVLAFIEQIKCPSMLVSANKGLRFNQDIMDKRKSTLSGLEEFELVGNHHVHMESPEEVAALVLDFLARHG